MKKLCTWLIAGFIMMNALQAVQAKEVLQIKGSDTLINLVQRLAEVYMEKNPGRIIAVTGGGSGTGIAALVNKRCDIANASRLMKEKEITLAASRSVDPKRIVIAMDGLSVIVNEKNSVTQLTIDQIGKLFRGEITNWKDVGGKDMPITLYGRQSNSGTFMFFMETVLKGDYSSSMQRMNGNGQIVEAIKQDVSGISYVGVGYAKNAAGIGIIRVAEKQGGVYASPLNSADVKSGKYPISRPLNQYVDGSPTEAARAFIAFELGAEGQRIVEEEGFFPIPSLYEDFNTKLGFK